MNNARFVRLVLGSLSEQDRHNLIQEAHLEAPRLRRMARKEAAVRRRIDGTIAQIEGAVDRAFANARRPS